MMFRASLSLVDEVASLKDAQTLITRPGGTHE